jgi:hypothetical protein
MEVLPAELKRDEEIQETSDVISRCRNAGNKVSSASAFLQVLSSLRMGKFLAWSLKGSCIDGVVMFIYICILYSQARFEPDLAK